MKLNGRYLEVVDPNPKASPEELIALGWLVEIALEWHELNDLDSPGFRSLLKLHRSMARCVDPGLPTFLDRCIAVTQ